MKCNLPTVTLIMQGMNNQNYIKQQEMKEW